MAYAASGLSALSYADGFTLWHYASADAIATVRAAGYFTAEAVDMLKVRDVVLVSDTNTPTMQWCIVLSNDGTTVDISDGTTIAETDTD
jgi:hypothetical protein